MMHTSFGQNSFTQIGAPAQGIGYATSCIGDEWSIFNNVAGMAKIKNPIAACTYLSIPSFKSFNRMAAVINIPFHLLTAGAAVYRFGDALYNEQILTLAAANKFGLASLGAKAEYIQYNIQGYGTKGFVSFSAGGIAELTPTLSVGAYIQHINQPQLSSYENEKLPTWMNLGISFKPVTTVVITSEIQKALDFSPTYKAGLAYEVHKKIIIRTGFNIRPDKAFFGLGFRLKQFLFDYAFAFSQNTGSQHQASVGYKIKKYQP
jgi:hypothetical protein